jgi:pimeloyl-ACP methyl ester carboxylesterase
MYCEESQKQAARSGISVRVSERRRGGRLASTWHVERAGNGAAVDTEFEFMRWDDIVRRHWHSGLARLYLLAIPTYWHMTVTTGLLGRVFRIAKWTFLTGIAPAVVLFGIPLVALCVGWTVYAMWPQTASSGWWPLLTGSAGFLAVSALGLLMERKLSLGWLLRIYAFVVGGYARGKIPELDERIDRFAERIAKYVRTSDDDEIVVVGHSVGANVAVSVLARALAIDPQLYSRYRPVGLLTLGGSIPMLGLLPSAQGFRDELAQLAADPDLAWVDIAAPQDAAAFARLNPVTASGVALGEAAPLRPHVVSASFRETLSPETYSKAVWDLFRMHFQYLMASEQERVHDYLSVTTDAKRFQERFAAPESGS